MLMFLTVMLLKFRLSKIDGSSSIQLHLINIVSIIFTLDYSYQLRMKLLMLLLIVKKSYSMYSKLVNQSPQVLTLFTVLLVQDILLILILQILIMPLLFGILNNQKNQILILLEAWPLVLILVFLITKPLNS